MAERQPRPLPDADAVGIQLADSVTRAETLAALEAVTGAHNRGLAMAAAPKLVELLAGPELDGPMFRRAGLLLARMVAEATDSPAEVYGAALGEGRGLAMWTSQENVVVSGSTIRAPSRAWAHHL